MNYGKKMKEIRTYDLNTQSEIARKMGISANTYAQYELQNKIIPLKHLNSFCNILDISVDYVLNLSITKKYESVRNNLDNKLISQRLVEIRKEKNLSQEALARILDVPRTTISGYELGTYLISTNFLYEICKKCKISADYLLGKIDDPKYIN